MYELFKPYARSIKYGLSYWRAKRKASIAHVDEKIPINPPPIFIVGCGRSGTTILGKLLMQHPSIFYYFEPYHKWAAVDPITDILNLYTNVNPRLILGARHVTESAVVRFNRLFKVTRGESSSIQIVEKTPLNAMRIGYLDSIAPNCKFIHIIRDGGEVSRSIANAANDNSYQIAGKPDLNKWWGVNNVKWRVLKQNGSEAGYFSDEIDRIENDQLGRGVYEWLVSLSEINCWRNKLNDRLIEISYQDLVSQPNNTLKLICSFMGVAADPSWLESSSKQLKQKKRYRLHMYLPPKMANAFNAYQDRYGFSTRAGNK